MSLILIFDLDDTLYPEQSYVLGGMQAVAKFISEKFSLDYQTIEIRLLEILKQEGRGKVFDIFLDEHGLLSKRAIRDCVKVYRYHSPNISLYPDAVKVITGFKGSKYLVTDGHKMVQQAKINALQIESFFQKIYLTNRYGIVNAKPSLHCFNKILEREDSSWENLIYVGDNPRKDFVNLNLMGSKTIRVLTGQYRLDVYPSDYDAKVKIEKLSELKEIFEEYYE